MPTLTELALADFDSDYVCMSCHSPLYQNITTEADVCLNPSCLKWPDKYSDLVDPQQHNEPGIHREMEKQKTNIVEMIQKCNLSTLRHFAHDQRGRLSSQFLKTGR